MLKKFVFSFSVLVLGFGGMMIPQTLSANSFNFAFDSEVSESEKVAVCCEMADQKIIDLGTALQLLRAGQLTITKVETGVYRVEYGGGHLLIGVLADNL